MDLEHDVMEVDDGFSPPFSEGNQSPSQSRGETVQTEDDAVIEPEEPPKRSPLEVIRA